MEFHGKRLLSRASRVAAAVQAAQIQTELEGSSKIAILSASGASVWKFWTAVPISKRDLFENLWFRTALRQRLHLSITSGGLLCLLRKAERGDELCLQELPEKHVYCYQASIARFRPHRSIIMSLADTLRSLGAYVYIERYWAELLRHTADGVSKEA